MSKTTDIITHVIGITRDSAEGREHAKEAVDQICEEIGATTCQRKVVLDALFSGYARPRISITDARKMLGGICRVTFWRWRQDDKYGLNALTIIPVNERRNETYLDEVLAAVERKATQDISK